MRGLGAAQAARGLCSDAMAADKTELRGLCPVHVAAALDALAMTGNVDRNTYIVQVLEKHVRDELHRASVLMRVMRGNPLLVETERSQTE